MSVLMEARASETRESIPGLIHGSRLKPAGNLEAPSKRTNLVVSPFSGLPSLSPGIDSRATGAARLGRDQRLGPTLLRKELTLRNHVPPGDVGRFGGGFAGVVEEGADDFVADRVAGEIGQSLRFVARFFRCPIAKDVPPDLVEAVDVDRVSEA